MEWALLTEDEWSRILTSYGGLLDDPVNLGNVMKRLVPKDRGNAVHAYDTFPALEDVPGTIDFSPSSPAVSPEILFASSDEDDDDSPNTEDDQEKMELYAAFRKAKRDMKHIKRQLRPPKGKGKG
eukprot:15437671-Alexandrium_andersonii.AAC.1